MKENVKALITEALEECTVDGITINRFNTMTVTHSIKKDTCGKLIINMIVIRENKEYKYIFNVGYNKIDINYIFGDILKVIIITLDVIKDMTKEKYILNTNNIIPPIIAYK